MNSKRHPRIIPHDAHAHRKPFQFIIAYYIVDPCVITEHSIIKTLHTIDLLDFKDNGEIEFRTVKFLNANRVDNMLQITVMDTKTKEVIQRRKLINCGVCDWVVTDLFTQPEEELIIDYCTNG
jgi:hypothetical protein